MADTKQASQEDTATNKGTESAAGGAQDDPRTNAMSQTNGPYDYTLDEKTIDPETDRRAGENVRIGLDMEADNGDHIAFALRRFLDKKSVTLVTQDPTGARQRIEGYLARRNMLVDTRDGVYYNEPASFTIQKAHVYNVLGEQLGDDSDMLLIAD